MSDTAASPDRSTVREVERLPSSWPLHVLTLSTVAVAQPLFEVLGNPDHAPFFVAHNTRAIDVLVLVACVSLVLPTVLCVLVWPVERASRKMGRALYSLVLVSLFVLAFLPPAGRLFAAPGSIVLSVVAAVLAVAFYLRTDWVRTFVSILSVLVLGVPALFLNSPTVRPLLASAEARDFSISSSSDRPNVVMIIFDELPLISLLDENREIDRVRYPNFHRVAEQATFYRNSTTTHFATSGAVASLLVGGEYASYLRRVRQKIPARSALLDRSNAPDNLFSMLENDYEISAIETTSTLAPETAESVALVPPLRTRLRDLAVDTAVLFAHIVVPGDLRGRLPIIEGKWSDFLGPKSVPVSETSEWRYGGSGLPVKRFRELLRNTGLPSLFYLHVLTPHFPFIFNERGQLHSNKFGFVNDHLRKAVGSNQWPSDIAADLAYQAHLLQVGYTDLLLGLILDRVEEVGLFDDAMVVVTADHGTSFYWDESGLAKEQLEAVQASETLYVPLIIKYPRQSQGAVSDEPVQTIDILPTVAEVAGAEVSWEIDGISLLGTLPSERERFAYIPRRKAISKTIDPSRLALARKIELFGTKSVEGVYLMGPYPGLVGKPLAAIPSVASTSSVEILDAERYGDIDPDGARLPAYVEGKIVDLPDHLSGNELAVAVAVNGIIRGTARCTDVAISTLRAKRGADPENGGDDGSSTSDGAVHFLARIPPDGLRSGDNEVTVHVVVSDGPEGSLSLLNLRDR